MVLDLIYLLIYLYIMKSYLIFMYYQFFCLQCISIDTVLHRSGSLEILLFEINTTPSSYHEVQQNNQQDDGGRQQDDVDDVFPVSIQEYC